MQIHENKSWLEIFLIGIVKNGRGQSSLWTLKLTAYEEWTDLINCFLHAGKNSC